MADTLELVQRKIEFRREILQISENADGPLTLRELAAESDWIDITVPQDMNTMRGIVVALEKDGYLTKQATSGRPAWVRSNKKYDPVDDDVALMEATESTKRKPPKSDILMVMSKAKKATDDAHHTVSQKLTDELRLLREHIEGILDEKVRVACLNLLDDELRRSVNYVREMEVDIKMLNAEKDNFINILSDVTTLITDVI